MKICDDLRQAVLQAAIQGKLTTQRKEDGEARELLKQIADEKAKLIKDKKIKKEKPLPEITEEEVPFDVPENWVWCRLGEILQLINGDRGKNYPSKDKLFENGSIPFISAINIQGNTVSKEKLLYLSKEQYELLGSGKLIQNDIVVCIRGSLGKSCIFPFEIGAIASSLVILRKYYEINENFLLHYVNSQLFYSEILRYDNGTAQPNLAAKDLSKFLIPLPPLAEQHRIVAKVDKLMAEIDELEKVENELHELKTAFPGDMKAALLQAAMQGKLTTQRKEDGDARDLLKHIAKEKEQLIKEKKIKKEKPLPEITEDEIPFDVPENWVWVRLGNICYINSGNIYQENEDGYYYVKVADMNLAENQTEIVTSTRKALGKESDLIDVNSIIFPKRGGAILTNKKRIVRHEPILVDSNTMAITVLHSHIFDYIFQWFRNIDLGSFCNGSAVPQINNKDIAPLLVPLPPLAEQHRIVAKLEKLLPLCDGLTEEKLEKMLN